MFENAEINVILDKNTFEPAQTELSVLIVFVPKKDETLQFFVDCCKRNVAIIPGSYPIPRLDKFVYSCGKAAVFSTLDASNGYWHIAISSDKTRTAFTTHHGLDRLIRVPFELRNALGLFLLTTGVILSSFKWQFAFVYRAT